MSSDKIREFKRLYIEAKPSVSVQRARIFTESHRNTEGESTIVRRAKAFKAVCENVPVTIFDGEIIDIKSLRTRKAGFRKNIELKLIVDKDMKISDAHLLCDKIEDKLEERLKNTDVSIHLEPDS